MCPLYFWSSSSSSSLSATSFSPPPQVGNRNRPAACAMAAAQTPHKSIGSSPCSRNLVVGKSCGIYSGMGAVCQLRRRESWRAEDWMLYVPFSPSLLSSFPPFLTHNFFFGDFWGFLSLVPREYFYLVFDFCFYKIEIKNWAAGGEDDCHKRERKNRLGNLWRRKLPSPAPLPFWTYIHNERSPPQKQKKNFQLH